VPFSVEVLVAWAMWPSADLESNTYPHNYSKFMLEGHMVESIQPGAMCWRFPMLSSLVWSYVVV
jgi:hypothetical protein